ncbi:hypothetical protein GCM10009550_52380 [Actinocorallia libanotica]|uniref:DUF5666 domain-containing protein n=2 Tax=Actinocorallia libanotica TaxID=46162 RepID=A0ABP4C664_9ACTN
MLPAMPEPTNPREVLDEPPFEGTLEEALAARPPRAKIPLVTLCLGAGVVAVAGFIGGVHADRQWGGDGGDASTTAPGRPGSSTRGGFPGAPGRQDQGGGLPGSPGGRQPGGQDQDGRFPGGRATTGTVSEVSGATVEVRTSDGRTVEVKVGDGTRVTTTREGSVEDIQPGAAVTVRGDRITVTPAP